jgi:RNA polymerase sigma factor for flagellar operon FliA
MSTAETPTVEIPETAPTAQVLRERYHCAEQKSEGDLVKQHLSLVKTVVGRLAMNLPAHVSVDDLQSAGLIGLLQAIRSYDPDAGASFETFARFRIRGAVLDELRRTDWVPRLVHAKARKIQQAMGDLEQKLGRIPEAHEVAKALNINLQEYENWLDEVRPATFICLDLDTAESGALNAHESVADESQEDPSLVAERNDLKELIAKRLQTLPEIQRKVLSLYYIEDLRLREIAEAFGLTESRISQIHSQAILAIRSFIEKQEFWASHLRSSAES